MKKFLFTTIFISVIASSAFAGSRTSGSEPQISGHCSARHVSGDVKCSESQDDSVSANYAPANPF